MGMRQFLTSSHGGVISYFLAHSGQSLITVNMLLSFVQRAPLGSTIFPYTTLFRSFSHGDQRCGPAGGGVMQLEVHALQGTAPAGTIRAGPGKTYSVRPPLADRPLSCCGS